MRKNLILLIIIIFTISLVSIFSADIIFGANPYNLPAYNVKDFNVVGDGVSLNTPTIQQIIDRAAGDGGGVVYFPPGNYVSGTIQNGSNVTLYLEAGATIWGNKNREDYVHGCLIYAEDAVNIAIRGRGSIDGNGTSFWKWENNRW